MKAVVLAAGTGSRLGPMTQDIPKCLVPVGGVPIIDHMINRLVEAGIDELIVVTGYRHEVLDEHLRESQHRLGREARTVFNPRYHDYGNFYSLLAAREAVGDDGFIQCDGDVILGYDIVPRLLAVGSGSWLTIDRGVVLGEEEMKVRIDDTGRVVAINKRMDPADSIGESISLTRIDAALAPALFGALERMIADGETHEYYERAYEHVLGQGAVFSYLEVDSAQWCEIDDAADLEHAHQVVARLERERQAS